ncbi:MAG: DUF4178 domain-containing protein [Lachnospiraceae bacterium]|nr:DUF4178 domain-containing protein [Lachnospiraceae bacterium]
MEYQLGDTLRVDGSIYRVTGKILYRNLNDNCTWFEYKIRPNQGMGIKWLSYDANYAEYSVSEVVRSVSTQGYHVVDSGVEQVEGAWGDVDVEVGDRASFTEYEDQSEEYIISSEVWDDGEEFSKGYYLDEHEVQYVSSGSGGGGGYQGSSGFVAGADTSYNYAGNMAGKFGKIGIIAFVITIMAVLLPSFAGGKTIVKHLKGSSYYTYVTSITGTTDDDADVYKSSLSLDATAKDIINAINGNTVDVQQNTEDGDNSIGILTKKEYCYIYVSEDDEVLVQISSREYAYSNDSDPYRSRTSSRRYYRRYYYSRGYGSDSSTYSGKYSSPYSSYTDSTISYNSSDTYSSYSSSVKQSSVRQSSTSSRSSSGGGTSSGK